MQCPSAVYEHAQLQQQACLRVQQCSGPPSPTIIDLASDEAQNHQQVVQQKCQQHPLEQSAPPQAPQPLSDLQHRLLAAEQRTAIATRDLHVLREILTKNKQVQIENAKVSAQCRELLSKREVVLQKEKMRLLQQQQQIQQLASANSNLQCDKQRLEAANAQLAQQVKSLHVEHEHFQCAVHLVQLQRSSELHQLHAQVKEMQEMLCSMQEAVASTEAKRKLVQEQQVQSQHCSKRLVVRLKQQPATQRKRTLTKSARGQRELRALHCWTMKI